MRRREELSLFYTICIFDKHICVICNAVTYDVDIATRSDYSIVGKEKQAHWYKDFNVNATTHSILVQEVGFDIQTHLTLLASYVPNFSIQEFTPISFVLVPKTQGNSTGITYIYLHATDNDGLQAWFASRPEGRWRMAIGTDKDIKTLYVHLDVLCSFLGLSMVGETEEAMRDSLLWIKDKRDAGALDVLVRTELPFPSGLTGYCNYIDWPEDAPPDPAQLAPCARHSIPGEARGAVAPRKAYRHVPP